MKKIKSVRYIKNIQKMEKSMVVNLRHIPQVIKKLKKVSGKDFKVIK